MLISLFGCIYLNLFSLQQVCCRAIRNGIPSSSTLVFYHFWPPTMYHFWGFGLMHSLFELYEFGNIHEAKMQIAYLLETDFCVCVFFYVDVTFVAFSVFWLKNSSKSQNQNQKKDYQLNQ